MTRDNDCLFGGNGSGLIVLLLFFLMMGRGGWNGYDMGMQGALTRAELNDGFMNQNLNMEVRSVADNIFGLNNTVRDGFAESARCCCETNRNIDAVRYENAQNTCAITTAIREDGEKTRAVLLSQQIQDLRDSREAVQRELQSAQLTLATGIQTRTITDNVLGALGRYTPYAGCCTPCGGQGGWV